MSKFLLAACALATAVLVVTGCGTQRPTANTAPKPRHTVSAAQKAIQRAVAAECANAQTLDSSVNSAQTVGQFASSVNGWEAQLTAMSHLPMTGVPQGANAAREIAVDYAKANLALFVAAMHDDPFGSHFSAHMVKRDYNMAVQSLQDVLNRCAAAGVS
jgi:hypothetical protein